MSASNQNVTNCKGYCKHYRKDDRDNIEFCQMDAHSINGGYAKGFCNQLDRKDRKQK